MKLSLLGAAKEVTGSKFLIEHEGDSYLLDAGMYQGDNELEELNKQPILELPAIKKLSAIILTHGHLDHCGLVPKIIADGFNGPIYASADTAELAKLLWQDTLAIEEDLLRHERTYHPEHVNRAKKLLKVVKPGQKVALKNGLEFKYYPNGHILGSQSILISHMGIHKLLLSSDLGRPHRYMQFERTRPPGAETIILESTYGDRSHEDEAPLAQLHKILTQHPDKKILMATFAIDRLQELLLLLLDYRDQYSLPHAVFIDSPMGTKSTKIYMGSHQLNGTIKHKLEFARRHFHWIEHASQRKAYDKNNGPSIMLASSGMLEGGRIRTYLRNMIQDPQTLLILTGYQAPETLGAKLQRGDKMVVFNGAEHTVKMEIAEIDGLSAHADDRGLLEWVQTLPQSPQKIILNHGEESAQKALQSKLNAIGYHNDKVVLSFQQQKFDL